MKTIKRIFLLVFSAMFFATTQTLNAQVTIGSELEPNKGSLLDLKENNTAPGANNSTKGFNLPRVALTSLSSLAPCYTGADAAIIANHKGLQVYNTNTDLGEGIYTWSGKEWSTVSQVLQSPSELFRFTAKKYFTGVITYTGEVNASPTSWAEFTCTKTGFYYYHGRYIYTLPTTTDPLLYFYITTDKDANTNQLPMTWENHVFGGGAIGYLERWFIQGITYLEAGKKYYLNFNTYDGSASIKIDWDNTWMNFMKIN